MVITAEQILSMVDLPPGVRWVEGDNTFGVRSALNTAYLYAVTPTGEPLVGPEGMYFSSMIVSDFEDMEMLRRRAINAAETLLEFVKTQRGSVP